MGDTSRSRLPPSGRFLLRLPEDLHAALRQAAQDRGLSLNEHCIRTLAGHGAGNDTPGGVLLPHALSLFGEDLIGAILFGSWARGEASAASDIDILVVLNPKRPVTRATYHDLDAVELDYAGHRIDAHLTHPPTAGEAPSGLWLEAAVDGQLLFDRQQQTARALAAVRRYIASGEAVRHEAQGHPYWTHER